MCGIGRIVPVDVRELWANEANDFSPWLAKSENIEYLNDILGLNLVDIKREVCVGIYRCDIVATDETSGDVVVIENQLEFTNHEHLGKAITYASMLNAKYIVWIVTKAREEHRAAIQWLNNNTVLDINFFLIEVHAHRIDNSRPAPEFRCIEIPNNYVKRSNNPNTNGELTRAESERLYFWEQLNAALENRGNPFTPKTPSTYAFYCISIGTTVAQIRINLVNSKKRIVVEFHIHNNRELFDSLECEKKEINSEFDQPLTWKREAGAASRIDYYINGLNYDDKSNYNSLITQTINTVVHMREVFTKYM